MTIEIDDNFDMLYTPSTICPRAFRTGVYDKELETQTTANPFMLPANRHAWKLGYDSVSKRDKPKIKRAWS